MSFISQWFITVRTLLAHCVRQQISALLCGGESIACWPTILKLINRTQFSHEEQTNTNVRHVSSARQYVHILSFLDMSAKLTDNKSIMRTSVSLKRWRQLHCRFCGLDFICLTTLPPAGRDVTCNHATADTIRHTKSFKKYIYRGNWCIEASILRS